MAARRPLCAGLAAALDALGEADQDAAMGRAMMADVLRLPECPEELVRAALASGKTFLARVARRRGGELDTRDGGG